MTPLEINKKIAELKGLEISGVFDNTIKTPRAGQDSLFFNWAEDKSNAFELFLEIPSALICSYNGNSFDEKGTPCILYYCDIGTDSRDYMHKSPAMAICLAWIAWKESNE